jgi:hypothetical protein
MPDLYPRWRWYQVKGFVCKIPAQSGKTISGYRYLRYPWQIHTAFTDKSDSNTSYPAAIAMDSFFYNVSSPPPYFLLCAIVWWPDWHPLDCTFKSTKKLNHDIWGLLYKSKLTGHCGFVLANLHSVESLLTFRALVESRQYSDSIAYLFRQSSIYTLNKIAQEEAQIMDKQMLF